MFPEKFLSYPRHNFLEMIKAFVKACRYDILSAVVKAGSGHTGGALSSLEFLVVAYLIASQTGEKVIVSNGHVSAAVYSILGRLGYIDRNDFIENFRSGGSRYTGQINPIIPGIPYGTGPLGCGVSVACGIALAEKKRKTGKRVFVCMGDGEFQEGQVFEMLHFAAEYKLDNLIVFMDYNKLQLSGSLKEIVDIDIRGTVSSLGWNVYCGNGHNVDSILSIVDKVSTIKNVSCVDNMSTINNSKQGDARPHMILGATLMGKGASILEEDALKMDSKWHGKAPSFDMVSNDLSRLEPTELDEEYIDFFRVSKISSFDDHKRFLAGGHNSLVFPLLGEDFVFYNSQQKVAIKDAYALYLELLISKNTSHILLFMADVVESIGITGVRDHFPNNYIECGIAEQNMLNVAAGVSLLDFIPFVSVYSDFCAKRCADQIRLNDINKTNIKMVCTHAGLSVGPDGPTHHALDDVSGILALRNTLLLEPADANMMLHITNFISKEYGNFYIRMGKHPLCIITKEDGSLYYDESYIFEYGKTDIIRSGNNITFIAIGSLCTEVFQAVEVLRKQGLGVDFIIVSNYKDFDQNIFESAKKTKKVFVFEDCFSDSGLSVSIKQYLFDRGMSLGDIEYKVFAPSEYLYDADSYINLYKKNGMDTESIIQFAKKSIT